MANSQLKKQIFLQTDNDDFTIRIQPTETEHCRWIFAKSLSEAFNMVKTKGTLCGIYLQKIELGKSSIIGKQYDGKVLVCLKESHGYFTVVGSVYLYSNFIDIIKNNQFDEIRFMNDRGYGNGISYKAGM